MTRTKLQIIGLAVVVAVATVWGYALGRSHVVVPITHVHTDSTTFAALSGEAMGWRLYAESLETRLSGNAGCLSLQPIIMRREEDGR